MTAELLRRAATQIREKAEGAPGGAGWYVDAEDVWVLKDPAGDSASCLVNAFPIWADGAAAHIASWHPVVALAVADWLEVTERDVGTSSLAYHAALNVARAYLGES